MDFQARIDADLKGAMKARQTDRVAVLRMLKTALQNAAIEKGSAVTRLDEPSALAVVRKEVKKRLDSVEGFKKGHRADLAAKEEGELSILNTYLPKPLTEGEVSALVAQCISETGATSKAQLGAVMKLATERAAGRADGKTLSAVVAGQLR
jgi:uncharacterized protein